MTSKRIEILLPNNKPLTELIQTASTTIGSPEKVYLRLMGQTKNERTIEVRGLYNEKEQLRKIDLYSRGNTGYGEPFSEELEYILKRFGGKESSINYETKTIRGDILKVTSDPLSSQLLQEYNKATKDMKTLNPALFATLKTERSNTSAEFSSREERNDYQPLWSLHIKENRPRGPFAEARMRRIEKYFSKYIAPEIRSIRWEVHWRNRIGGSK